MIDQRSPGAAGHAAPTVNARGRLRVICITHTGVDFFSALVIPLLSVLEGSLNMTAAQGALLVGVGSVCSGLIQPIVAWLSDRFDTRLLGTLGMLLAVLAMGAVGLAETYTQLLLLQIVGTAGAGAFHPVAAATMGHLAGNRRAAAISVFFTAGMIGSVAGNFFAPAWVRAMGLPALAWTIIPGLVGVAMLAWAMHAQGGVPHRAANAHAVHDALPERERRARWAAVWVLYASNVIRFTVNMALVQLIVRYAEQTKLLRTGEEALDMALREQAASFNGMLQAAMNVGMGIGGVWAGLFLKSRHEKAALVLVPVLGAACIALVPHTGSLGVGAISSVAAFVVAVGCGIGYAGVIPVTITLAQRLLPHRTSLASGLMMGGAWMVAGVGPPLAEALIPRLGLNGAFAAVGAMLLCAGVLSAFLPGRVLRGVAGT